MPIFNFDNPSLALFEQFVPALLTYKQNLKLASLEILLEKATRIWIILRSLYDSSDARYYLVFKEGYFKCAYWQAEFFKKISQQTTLATFLFDHSHRTIDEEWEKALKECYKLRDKEITKINNLTPFAVDPRTIRNDFKRLFDLKYLEKKGMGQYKKIPEHKLPLLSAKDSHNANEDYQYFEFLHEELYPFADSFAQEINGSQRFYLFTEYIVPKEVSDLVGEHQDKLRNIWRKDPISPIEIVYKSASLGQTTFSVVYPVWIAYYQRAPYLCAFGKTFKQPQELSWYNYRLDRIIELTELDWDDDSSIPDDLREKFKRNNLPTSSEIILAWDEALGFDFYRPKATMMLRFKPDFHQRYIKGTLRHETFEEITIAQATRVINKLASTNYEKYRCSKTLEKFPDHGYYLLNYRVDDNNVIMRLRAWGDNVEVMLPLGLRKRIFKDIVANYLFYQESENLCKS